MLAQSHPSYNAVATTMNGSTLGILVGISKYDSQPALPACSSDVAAMKDLLTLSGTVDVDHLLVIDDNRRSAEIKSQLADFVRRHSTDKTAEVIFYFSGHGTYDDDFRFILPDYREDHKNATTLTNTELDGMLRSLKPDLAIKVVDACQSAVSYVKDVDYVKAALAKTIERFNHCYFMFSSQQNQFSYKSPHHALSDFTQAFITAFTSREPGTIRYRDIVDSITDWFDRGTSKQIPLFVVQAPNTEVFCGITQELKNVLGHHARVTIGLAPLSLNMSVSDVAVATDVLSAEIKSPADQLVEAVQAESSEYCTHDMMNDAFLRAEEAAKAHTPNPPLPQLYDLQVGRSRLRDMKGMTTVAGWFKDRTFQYFVDLVYEDEEYETTVEVEQRLFGLPTGQTIPRTVTGTRKVLRSVEHTEAPPFEVLSCLYVPKHSNLHYWHVFFALFASKTEIAIFRSLKRLRDRTWNERVIQGGMEWSMSTVKYKDTQAPATAIDTFLKEADELLLREIGKRFGIAIGEDRKGTAPTEKT
jgi:hypothetical protein